MKVQPSFSVNIDKSKYRGRTVLVVDDEVAYRVALKKLIEEHIGAKVEDAEDPVIMFEEILPFRQPDLIILDMQMPNMDGKQALEKLRNSQKFVDIPVLACTAVTDREFIVGIAKLGVSGYIAKPFTKSVIVDRVVEVLDGGTLLEKGV